MKFSKEAGGIELDRNLGITSKLVLKVGQGNKRSYVSGMGVNFKERFSRNRKDSRKWKWVLSLGPFMVGRYHLSYEMSRDV